MKNNIINYIYRKKDINKLVNAINLFGSTKTFSVETFLNFRLISSVLLFIAIILFNDFGYIYAPVITLIYYYSVYYILIYIPLNNRSKLLESDSLYFFEILSLSLESGRSLESAIDLTSLHINSSISTEFKEALYRMKFGKSLSEALEEMKMRIPSEAVNNIIINISGSSLFGNNIVETMNNQVKFLRNKKTSDIKTEIGKIPTKISIFSVLFFIPIMLLLILSPIIIDFLTK